MRKCLLLPLVAMLIVVCQRNTTAQTPEYPYGDIRVDTTIWEKIPGGWRKKKSFDPSRLPPGATVDTSWWMKTPTGSIADKGEPPPSVLPSDVALDKQEVISLIQDEIRKLQGEILTTYSPDGEPVFQAQDAKGWHRQFGTTKLVDGLATIDLNSSPSEGKQDVSYVADSTYRGAAWSLDSANTKTYWVIPLSGKQVLVKSSDNTDTATVRFFIEGM